MAGGAGFMLGMALIAPGEDPRGVAVAKAGRKAITVMMGAAIMLAGAAFIEAFWSSSSVIPAVVKYVVGLLLWLLVGTYLFRAGRSRGP